MRLRDKVLVIVGGTSGLGLSAARVFIKEGARVVVVGRDQQKCHDAGQEFGPSATTLVGDASAPNTAAQAIQAALERYGAFHGLYHVAGGSGRARGDGPLDSITDEGWAYTLQENLTSLFYSNRAAVRQFLTQKSGGSILNMSSVLAFAPSPRYFGTHAYAATKAGAVGLTTSAAAHYAPWGIRCNVLAPALVATPMSQRAQSDSVILEFIRSKQPLDGGRIGHPSDLDGAAVYFMSDESKFVTGQVLAVDGGWSVSEGRSA